jgi:hypothetical protein
MNKCPETCLDARSAQRDSDPAPRRFIAQRLRFDALVRRDRALWLAAADADALRRLASEVARELVPDDFGRFVDWTAATHGLSVARAAGLAPSPLRLVVSA